MLSVLESDFGLDKTGLFKDTALFGYGWQRQGPVIKERFESALYKLKQQGFVIENSDGKINIQADVIREHKRRAEEAKQQDLDCVQSWNELQVFLRKYDCGTRWAYRYAYENGIEIPEFYKRLSEYYLREPE